MHTEQRTIYLALAAFLGLRIVSLGETLYQLQILPALLSLVVLAIFTFLCIRKPHMALVILSAELMLGGAGGFLSLGGLLIRTWMLGIFLLLWAISVWRDKSWRTHARPTLIYILGGLSIGVVTVATVRGIMLGHGVHLALQDAVLYGFIILALPMMQYMQTLRRYAYPITVAYLIGMLSIVTLTFIRYSSGLGQIHDSYYRWFRDVAGGKVTDLGYHFFRIVSSEQLFLLPILLILCTTLIYTNAQKKKYWILLAITIALLMVNMTRIYLLAGVVGGLVLVYQAPIKAWAQVMFTSAILSIVIFMGISTAASRGNIMGLELVGLKTRSISAPLDDASAATRLLIWPEAMNYISERPIFGSGLATPVTFIDPVTKQPTTRTQFDMGYIEMLVELGIIGTLIYLSFIISIARRLYIYGYRQVQRVATDTYIARALLASIIALAIVNLTTPALFQGFGVLILAASVAFITATSGNTEIVRTEP
jgi:hypothetical protein